ncbi:efflux RND transporter periplasmic adaptor subunit [Meridianimarinicoccus aquatilis]|uniref:Efflux RND transporter periplasmic adaptor subunit n=1 Tax=Meridianimarinicoccus aquatilis TaxID=2552766 RepID=A0A4R6APC5_9RHOB|nr:efflux RND transporter periplasmic adaptor subunit [Fluviibacterium aquatile]QIE42650.1 efflux RND transporter periplasmic adaptor subunit [Rhodobacteraceae bacterium SC52]TDL85302.1 efflux RND transporter periplasmic adaptor subunit [Fluviibacterium aquatile]
MPRSLSTAFTTLLIVLCPLTGYAQTGEASAPRVSVAAAVTEDVVQDASFIARVEAIDSVDLVARVTGFVQNVLVKDGTEVSTGDVLFRIEPEQYDAIVASRRADLSQAEANLTLAEIELDRNRTLVAREAVAQSELDRAQANEKVAVAQVKAAEAALSQAELDLSYTRITAPFDGRIGRIGASAGELVTPSSGALATLVSEAPIYVTFSLGESALYDVMQATLAAGGSIGAPNGQISVTVRLPNGTDYGETGTLAFGDNRVDPTTGTLAVRAKFENADRLLVDGAFVTARLAAKKPVQMLTIPQAAVQRDQRGGFVLVVGPEQTVEQRYITTGQQVGTSIAVEDGLQEGETVIVEGLQRVRPGVPVEAVLAGSGN